MLEKTLESALHSKEIQPVHPKGDQSWVFIGRTDIEAETPILWPPDAKSWFIWKDPDVGKDWRQRGEGYSREWEGWMASLTQWRWVWVNSGSWWWIGGPGMLWSMGSWRVGHEWATELNWTDRTGCHDLSFLKAELKSAFSLFSFTFIKRLFNSSSISSIRVVSSAYLRLLIFVLEILIPAYASSSLAFHMMYSAYKLNKQGDNIQPCHTPFPIWNQSVVPCPVLTVTSWPAYRFLRRQVRWSGIPISLSKQTSTATMENSVEIP